MSLPAINQSDWSQLLGWCFSLPLAWAGGGLSFPSLWCVELSKGFHLHYAACFHCRNDRVSESGGREGCCALRWQAMRALLVTWLFAALAFCAVADPLSPIQTAFHDGRFEEAARRAASLSNADAKALAARALLAKAMCADSQPPVALVDEAETLARTALSIDPGHVEGRLQLAIALSLKMRPMSAREAMRAGHGEVARELAEAVLRDDPGNSYAHGLMAVWHIEVVRRGGVIGSAMMGASVRRGMEHYDAARRARPDDASIHWQFARALAALNARKYDKPIRAALEAAHAAGRDDALEGVMAARAAHLSMAMDVLDPREIERLAEGML